jgi:hypothetical protein
MTSIKKCLEHWESIDKCKAAEIQDIIKELDKICISQPFNYSMFESRMNDLRRLRIEREHMVSFITSLQYFNALDNTWTEN